MRSTPSGYESAWAARSNPTIAITVDGTSVVDQVRKATVTREMVGDLPDEASFVGGVPSAKATLEIDAPKTTLHPLVSGASILGKSVAIRGGFGGTGGMVDIFSGWMRNGGFDQAARTQSREAIDGSDRMRSPVSLQGFGSIGQKSGARRLQRFPTNTSAVMVAALHACGIRVTPTPPTGTVVSIPMVGGMLADIGGSVPYGPGLAVTSWLNAGKWGPVPVIQGAQIRGIPATSAPWRTDAHIFAEAWVYYQAQSADWQPLTIRLNRNLGGVRLNVGGTGGVNPGKIWPQVIPDSGSIGPTIPPGGSLSLTTGWHRIAFDVDFYSNITVWVDGSSWTSAGGSALGPAISQQIQIEAPIDGRVQAINLGWSTSAMSPSSTSFTAQADIDAGTLDVDAVPPTSGVEAWKLMQEVAKAELGLAGLTESGRFRFQSRATINSTTASVLTLADNAPANITGSVDVDGLRTRVTAPLAKPWMIDSGYGSDSIVAPVPTMMLDAVTTIPAGATVNLTLTSSRPFMPRSAFVYQPTTYSAAQNVDAGIVLMNSADGSGSIVTANIMVGLSVVSPTQAVITVRNLNGYAVYPVWPTSWATSGVYGLTGGSPAAWILGYRLAADTDWDAISFNQANAAAAATWGDRTLELDASVWRSDPTTMATLVTGLLSDLSAPRPVVDPIEVPADPRLQLGDLVTVPSELGGLLGRLVSIVTSIDPLVESRMVQKIGFRMMPLAAPVVTVQPSTANVGINAYDTLSYASAASGNPSPSVQWQVREGPAPNAWTDIPGATSAALNVSASPANGFPHEDSTYYLRAVWTSGLGTATSNMSGAIYIYMP